MAAYDTVWFRGLHLKLLQTPPNCHFVDFILEMLTNRCFTLHTSDDQHSWLRRLKNGISQGSVLAPMLFNIYVHDLPPTHAKKYGFAEISPSYSLTSAGRQFKRVSLRTCQPCPSTSRTGASSSTSRRPCPPHSISTAERKGASSRSRWMATRCTVQGNTDIP